MNRTNKQSTKSQWKQWNAGLIGVGFVGLGTAACRPTNPPPRPEADSSATTTTVETTAADVASPRGTAVDPCSLVVANRDGADLLDLAFEDGELSLQQRRACLLSTVGETPARRRAREFALARRLPSSELAGWWDSVEPQNRAWMVRAIAGRQRTLNALLPPHQWSIDPELSASYGTIVSRFRLAEGTEPATLERELRRGLFAATLEAQLAAARRLRMARWIPTVDELTMLSPLVVPAVVKSLADRDDAAQVPWRLWAEKMLPRARLAPRIWGNAWRALRDGVPKSVRTALELPLWTALLTTAPAVVGLTDDTLGWFVCEDALAVDRWTNHVEQTRTCAAGPQAWIAAVAQARVLAEMTDSDAQRARALTELKAIHGPAQVLAEIATAACALRTPQALPLIEGLSHERDPGVLAALIEGIVTHDELVRRVPAATRDALIAAPFDGPEGPMLEARVQAIKLARATQRMALIASHQTSEVRAIRSTFVPDASVVASSPEPIASDELAARVRFDTDAGSFELLLEPTAAPLAVQRFIQTVQQGRYAGLRFHRIVPGFVAQGGDPRGDGYGGTETPIRTELALRAFDRGAVGIPLAGLDTGGMQLFVVTADAPHLDARYPWVGRVVRGIDAVDGLLPGDRIRTARVLTTADP